MDLYAVLGKQNALLAEHHNLRKGQAFYIALNELYPKIAKAISGTEYDPFYIDARADSCINYIMENH